MLPVFFIILSNSSWQLAPSSFRAPYRRWSQAVCMVRLLSLSHLRRYQQNRGTFKSKWARYFTTQPVLIVTKNFDSLLKLGHARLKEPKKVKPSHFIIKITKVPSQSSQIASKKKIQVRLETKIILCFFLCPLSPQTQTRSPSSSILSSPGPGAIHHSRLYLVFHMFLGTFW